MRRQDTIFSNTDWTTVFLFIILIFGGWLNIYASIYDSEVASSIFDFQLSSGRQFVFICVSMVLALFIMVLDFRFFDTFSYLFYALAIVLLIGVLVLAREINGAKSWIEFGGFRFQPSEFAKIATALAMAKLVGTTNFKMNKWMDVAKAVLLFLVPMGLVVIQGDLGTALVFLAFMLVLFREGMTSIPLVAGFIIALVCALTILVETLYLLIGFAALAVIIVLLVKKTVRNIVLIVLTYGLVIGSVYSVDYMLNEVLAPHQKDRIELVFNPNMDPLGKGWNLTQSKIAIGSGGVTGKGFLEGTQTKFNFVPEQSTDFIFCTIGEEHGFLGSFVLIALFITLILRVVNIAERQKWRFARVYGYGVATILFVHFTINIGMTVGLLPVIGIPLPFFSYGGSSLIAFTILLFILLKFDAHRHQLLDRG